jgi:arylsulfatase A-like enzyme
MFQLYNRPSMNRLIATALFLLIATPLLAQTTRPVPGVDHVLIISVDGLRPDVLLRGDTPNMHRLYLNGSFTFWAKTTAQSITLPSHVSMLTGVTPEVHAILWNADMPFSQPVYPAVPTVFELAKRGQYTTGLSAGKHKFIVFDKPGALDWKYIADSTTSADEDVTDHATQIIQDHSPNLMFVHLPATDNVGHAKGWGSPEQLEAVAGADRCIGLVLAAEAKANLLDSTIIILTADHGGAGRTHGPEDARSRTIPWIISGPGIRKGLDLTLLGHDNDVQTFDTFATACAILGLHWPVTDPVIGKSVSAAFEQEELMLSTFQPKMAPAIGETMK